MIRLERSRRADLRAAAEALGLPMAELVRRGLRSELISALARESGIGADGGPSGVFEPAPAAGEGPQPS